MQPNLIELNNLIQSSGLNSVEQKEFLSLFSKRSDEEIDIVLNACKDDSIFIEKLYLNYKEKEKALGQRDGVAQRDILQDEHDTLRQIKSLDY